MYFEVRAGTGYKYVLLLLLLRIHMYLVQESEQGLPMCVEYN